MQRTHSASTALENASAASAWFFIAESRWPSASSFVGSTSAGASVGSAATSAGAAAAATGVSEGSDIARESSARRQQPVEKPERFAQFAYEAASVGFSERVNAKMFGSVATFASIALARPPTHSFRL